MTGAPVDRGLLGEDRRKLDRRRWRASAIDNLMLIVVVGPLYLHYGVDLATWTFAAALSMAYHFVFDLTSGQTPGKRRTRLRVVMADGSPVTNRAASARSLMRLLDYNVGLLVYVLSGRRRRRIGDYAGGTIVCDVERVGTFKRALHVEDLVYPFVWTTTGIVAVALTVTGHTPWSYRARADRICTSGRAVLRAQPSPGSSYTVLFVGDRTAQYLQHMDVPRNWRGRHAELLRRIQNENALLAGWSDATPEAIAAQAAADRDALRRLGYRDCAELASALR